MAVPGADYTGCSILIYDTEGNHLGNTVVTDHDKATLRIEVQSVPAALAPGAGCRLLILMAPTPYEYHGRVVKEGTKTTIAMYKGKEKENRGAARYRVDLKALIENLVCDGHAYPLHTPLEVIIVNISRSGVRFRTPYFAMMDGDRFQMRIEISGNEKLLIADVTNHTDRGTDASEYGCRFLISN